MVKITMQEYNNEYYILTIEQENAYKVVNSFKKSDISLPEIAEMTKTERFGFNFEIPNKDEK